ncbi:MAG: hypothetical protein ABIG96_06265 [Candidatus Micrarchaeota archaeon]
MQKFVYQIEAKDYGKLKGILAADPYSRDSFAINGYVLKESKPLGPKGGFYLLFFKTMDDELVPKLKARLSVLETLKELAGAEKDSIVSQIEGEEDNAAAGIGNIFG